MMQIDVLDNGRRRSDEQGRHRGNRRRNRAYDSHAGKPGWKRLRDGLRDDVVDAAAVAGEIAREHACGQHAEGGHTDHHEPDDDRAHDHRAVERLGVLKAHAAHRRLGQNEREDAHKQPLREVERRGHGAAAEGLEHLGAVRADGVHDVLVAATGGEDARCEHENADEHGDAAYRVGHRNPAEAADGSEQHNRHAEEHEPHQIRVPGDGLEELRAAHELRDHRRREEEHDHDRAHVGERVGGIARADDVDHGDGIELARDERHFLPQDAVEQNEGRDLHDRHVNPAPANEPRLPGAAHERAHRAVGGDRRHGEHKPAEGAVADEVLLHETAACRMRAPAHDKAHRKREDEE